MSKGCSRLIALPLAGLAIFSCPLAVWVGAGVSTMFSPHTYKIALASQNIYAELVPAGLASFANSETQGTREPAANQLTAIVQALDSDELRAITNNLVPPEWLQAQTESAIDALFGWLNGEQPNLVFTFDFSELSGRLSGEAGREAASAIVQSAPPCSREQIDEMEAWRQGELEMPPICQPSPPLVSPLTTWIANFLSEIAVAVENSAVSFPQVLGRSDAFELRNLRLQVTVVQQLIGLLYLLPAGLLALIITIRVESLKGFCRWTGWIGMIGGLVALVPLLVIPLATLDTLLDLANNIERNPLENSVAAGFYYSILTQFGGPVLVQSVVLLVVGFLLVAISVLAHPTSETGLKGGETRTVSVPNRANN